MATSPLTDRRTSQRRWLYAAAVAIPAVALAHVLDRWAWSTIRDPLVYEHDWGRLLRCVGYLPTWCIIAIGCWTHDHPREGWRWRGGLLLGAPLLGGALAELLKLCLRRLRPDPEHFGYVFRAWSDHPFSTGGLGLPSSHTMVAFAGASALSAVFPNARWLWFALAAACAVTRVMATAHFLSDIVVAAILGVLLTAVLRVTAFSRFRVTA